ncbi:phage regulatory CII family protein [Vibrio vulnificus]|uniref:phage regulatory CII family protein n=1 Tax=Vibrio vulnificus TaxID=672 RepID=UPI000CD11A2F|nr:phage regulatory CII family protein [Vibrio vulnificus]MCA4015058.1 phage regulatory CII family protein [Vibrio vulnificus]POB16471.1 hypothetical protein CRN36_19065 [Vibrio vulnificus]HAS6354830.1 hypothetical protein [Vibrio vulnificus]HAS6368701.1 hypothetical protein [Vibrio vulnificus]
MLRNKLNPERPHVLNPVDLIALTKASDNHSFLIVFLHISGLYGHPFPLFFMQVVVLTNNRSWIRRIAVSAIWWRQAINC